MARPRHDPDRGVQRRRALPGPLHELQPELESLPRAPVVPVLRPLPAGCSLHPERGCSRSGGRAVLEVGQEGEGPDQRPGRCPHAPAFLRLRPLGVLAVRQELVERAGDVAGSGRTPQISDQDPDPRLLRDPHHPGNLGAPEGLGDSAGRGRG